MQIFRPFPEHWKSAKYLDDKRLNKQVLESYQINNMILKALGLEEGTSKTWFNHPVVRSIWNDGKPFLPDHWIYMDACDKEWQRRGCNRSPEFRAKIDKQIDIINDNRELFNWSPMEEYFRFGDKEIYGKSIYPYFRALLKAKWKYDKSPSKCSIKK